MRIDSKTYLNFILTVIAVLLLVLAAQIPLRLDPATSAQAANGVAVAGEQGGVKDIGLTTEQGVSRAMEKIADANLQIAKAIDGVADQIGAINKAMEPANAPASSGSASPAR